MAQSHTLYHLDDIENPGFTSLCIQPVSISEVEQSHLVFQICLEA